MTPGRRFWARWHTRRRRHALLPPPPPPPLLPPLQAAGVAERARSDREGRAFWLRADRPDLRACRGGSYLQSLTSRARIRPREGGWVHTQHGCNDPTRIGGRVWGGRLGWWQASPRVGHAVIFHVGNSCLPPPSHLPFHFLPFRGRWSYVGFTRAGLLFLEVEPSLSVCKSHAPVRMAVRLKKIISCCATRLECRRSWPG